MSDTSGIEWTDATWNPVVGCTPVSPGCDHCYAVGMSARLERFPEYAGLVADGEWTGTVRELPNRLGIPSTWQRPRLVFVNSMSDLFHPRVSSSFIDQVWQIMSDTPRHTYQVLTKRPERMRMILSDPAMPERIGASEWPLPNVWVGTSIETSRYAFRGAILRDVPAIGRFLSLEPLLGSVEDVSLRGIGWVIVGGESGAKARPLPPGRVRLVRDYCSAAGVPFFFKQWGTWAPVGQVPEEGTVTEIDGVSYMRLGKRKSGRLLDGRVWDDMPDFFRRKS